MKHNLPSEFLLHITNRKTDQTFSVPLQYEEMAQIIQGIALYDNRIGTLFDGVTGAYEEYFELIKPDEFTTEVTSNVQQQPSL
tara:strand:+ start:337 stop:585 length:249 start_codon:yes stop_codon:yes gene_type:complete